MRCTAWAAAALLITGAPTAGAWAQGVPDTASCEAILADDAISTEERQPALAACAPPADATPRHLFLHGRALYAASQDAEALAAFEAAGERGYAPALDWAGSLHQYGQGTTADPARARAFYERALAAGHLASAMPLGQMHLSGTGAAKDPAKAAALFRRASDADLADGHVNLGYAYETGAGVPKDIKRAVELYRKAAAANSPYAQANLGVLYSQGRGVTRNDAESVRWLQLAAAQGHKDAMFNLGLAYDKGVGIPASPEQAEHWWRKSTEAGDEVDAPNSLAYLYARQNRKLDEAEALATAALKAGPANPAVMDTLGYIHLLRGQPAKAALLFRQAAALRPSPLFISRLGDAYAALGLKADAREAWRRALALRPKVDAGVTQAELRRKLAGRPDPSGTQDR